MKAIIKISNRLLWRVPVFLFGSFLRAGAKSRAFMTSSFKKEYLIQSYGETFKKSGYDSNFADGDVSGFDEVFPSIERCYYPLEPWKGIQVPDHGEVWSMPWTYEVQGDIVVLSVQWCQISVSTSEENRFLRDQCFRITYKAENLSDFDFHFIWAPHMLLQCEEDTEIVLPKLCKECDVHLFCGKQIGKVRDHARMASH